MIHIYISGSVQGVGFRQYIKSKAKKLNVKGWIQNLPDRRVEVMLIGDRKSMDIMIEICRKGPFLAEVKNVEIRELPDEKFESFEVVG